MDFQILKIVLWPRNPAFGPRVLPFKPGVVNVVTGASKTGKSAVIPIIDYCLGSDGCSIPVRTIRDSCSWFGIVVRTSGGELLLARREPGSNKSTGEMFIVEGPTVEIPSSVVKNTTVDHVKRKLDGLAGLSSLGFDPNPSASGYRGRPAFRDLAAFMFQPQNVVANPDVLFYKTDTTEHKEKLKTIFPYVLGAMTPELLAQQWAADRLKDELRRAERELFASTKATDRWRSELQRWASDARDRGLIAEADYEGASSEPALLMLLRSATAKTSRQAEVTSSAVDESSREAAELDREESKIALDLADVRSRMERIQRLRASIDDYTGALGKQRDRLILSRWMRAQLDVEAKCPICGGDFEGVQHELDSLCDALAEIEASSKQLAAVPAVFDRELVEVRGEVRRLTDRLQGVRVRRRGLEERSSELSRRSLQASEVDRFLGRLEQGLVMFEAASSDSAASDAVEKLRTEYEELRKALSSSGWRHKLDAALARLTGFMGRTLPSLDAERPNDPVLFSVEDLTLCVLAESGRKDSLWEIGSGANWLAYHVAITIALHQLFREQQSSPVPGLIAYDQPSQVYFPRKLAGVDSGDIDAQLKDEDVAAVRKVFEVLGDATIAAAGALQVLILDHAGDEVWGGVDGVHLVEEWRLGSALVPRAWLT